MTQEKLIIKFDRWWKKIKNSSGLFTTIRRFTPDKKRFYKENIGKVFDIVVTDTKDGFKGFNEDGFYLLLLFEFTGIREARLLHVDDYMFEHFSKELIEYDTRE